MWKLVSCCKHSKESSSVAPYLNGHWAEIHILLINNTIVAVNFFIVVCFRCKILNGFFNDICYPYFNRSIITSILSFFICLVLAFNSEALVLLIRARTLRCNSLSLASLSFFSVGVHDWSSDLKCFS